MLAITIATNKRNAHGWIFWILGGWFVFWALQVQQIRFILPMLPLLTMLVISSIHRWNTRSWPMWIVLSILWSHSPLQQLIQNQQGQVYWNTLYNSDSKTAQQSFLDHRLPENHPVYSHINTIDTKKVWLVWMRGYHYYLDKPARIDNVFGAARFEKLLLTNSVEEIQQSLRSDNISHVVINWRFFIQNNNADYLGNQSTSVIQERFTEMIQKKILIPIQQWGPVWLYEFDEDSSSE